MAAEGDGAGEDKPRLWRPLDLLVVALIVALGVKTLPWLWTAAGHTALVRVEGRKVMRLELSGPERRAQVPGALGPVEIAWGETGARVVSAPCPNQVCLRSGRVLRRGHRVVCAPSRLEIAVERGPRDESAPDAVTF